MYNAKQRGARNGEKASVKKEASVELNVWRSGYYVECEGGKFFVTDDEEYFIAHPTKTGARAVYN